MLSPLWKSTCVICRAEVDSPGADHGGPKPVPRTRYHPCLRSASAARIECARRAPLRTGHAVLAELVGHFGHPLHIFPPMTRTQRQTTGRPPRARRSPTGSAATPQRSTPAMHCRPLSSAELALVVGVLLGRTVEVPTAPATQTAASAPASGRAAHPQPCPDARACRNRGRELADGLPARWEEIIRLARQWEPYGGPPEEEIYVQFGLPRPDYLDRLARINSRRAPGPLAAQRGTASRPASNQERNHTGPDADQEHRSGIEEQVASEVSRCDVHADVDHEVEDQRGAGDRCQLRNPDAADEPGRSRELDRRHHPPVPPWPADCIKTLSHEPDWPDAKQSVAELNEGKQGRRAAGSTPSGSATC